MSIIVRESENSVEMPKYQCHKKVWALKISALEFQEGEGGAAKIAPADAGYAPFTTPLDWAERFHGSEDDLGYYVVYAGGYASWSPSKEFEDGYTRI